MPIKYTIQENQLTTPTSFKGRAIQYSNLNLDTIIQDVLNQGSTVTEPDILAVIKDIIKACMRGVLNGSRVDIEGLIQLYPTMEGVFTSVTDSFDPNRHKLNISVKVSEKFMEEFRSKVIVEKDQIPSRTPTIYEVIDTNPGNVNSTLTQNKMINILGEFLKFNSDQADEGLYFINDTTPAETKQPDSDINVATDGKIIFIPTVTGVTGDTCHLELRTRMGNSTTYPLKIATSVPLTMG